MKHGDYNLRNRCFADSNVCCDGASHVTGEQHQANEREPRWNDEQERAGKFDDSKRKHLLGLPTDVWHLGGNQANFEIRWILQGFGVAPGCQKVSKKNENTPRKPLRCLFSR